MRRCTKKWQEKYVTSWKCTSDRRSASFCALFIAQPYIAPNAIIFRHFCFTSIINACNHYVVSTAVLALPASLIRSYVARIRDTCNFHNIAINVSIFLQRGAICELLWTGCWFCMHNFKLRLHLWCLNPNIISNWPVSNSIAT